MNGNIIAKGTVIGVDSYAFIHNKEYLLKSSTGSPEG